MASQAMTVIRFSMASWAMTFCWTACGQPNRTWPGLIFSRSWGIGLGKTTRSPTSRTLSRVSIETPRSWKYASGSP